MLVYITVRHKQLGVIQNKVVTKINKKDNIYEIGKKWKAQICREENDKCLFHLSLYGF